MDYMFLHFADGDWGRGLNLLMIYCFFKVIEKLPGHFYRMKKYCS